MKTLYPFSTFCQTKKVVCSFYTLAWVINAMLLALVFVGVVIGDSTEATPATMPKERVVLRTSTGEHVIQAEIARTVAQQNSGLMFRQTLGDMEGMLFLFEPAREVGLWMRNTLIPLDMVFILPDGTVHRIERDTEPLSERHINSNGPVSAVLELNGGAAGRLGLRPGDKVLHPFFK